MVSNSNINIMTLKLINIFMEGRYIVGMHAHCKGFPQVCDNVLLSKIMGMTVDDRRTQPTPT